MAGGALASSAMIDNLWSSELALEPALLRRPLAEWRGRERSLKLGDPTKSIDMVSRKEHRRKDGNVKSVKGKGSICVGKYL